MPRSDPNAPSHMHRMMKLLALKQITAQSPALYDQKAVDTLVLQGLDFGADVLSQIFAQPAQGQAPGPTPAEQAQATDQQFRQAMLALSEKKLTQSAADKAADRRSKEHLQVLKLAQEVAVHPGSKGDVDSVVNTYEPQAGRTIQ